MQLGSVLAPDTAGPRGPNLVVEIEVPRAAVGRPDGYLAEVPRRLPHAGEWVERAVSPLEDGEWVRLQVPAGFPDNGALKLRGQGGKCAGGAPGDLIVRITLVKRALETRQVAVGRGTDPRMVRMGVALAVLSAGGVGLWLWLG